MDIDFSAYENDPTDPHSLLALSDSLASHYFYETSLMVLESILLLDGVDADLMSMVKEKIYMASYHSKDSNRLVRAKMMTDEMSLDRVIGSEYRSRARENNFWYASGISKMMPSAVVEEFSFDPPTEYHPCNTSIHRYDNTLWMSQRRVNYDILRGMATIDGEQFRSRNWIIQLDEDLSVRSSGELLRPDDMPEPMFHGASGFEDLRLFTWKDELWTSFSTWDLNDCPRVEMAMGKIVPISNGYTLTDWKVLGPTHVPIQAYQKNWMPFVEDDRLRFVYASDPVQILDENADIVIINETSITAEHFRGGTQLISFDGGWLALIHEMHATKYRSGRYYLHRFVWYDQYLRLSRITLPFFFVREMSVEFASGMEYMHGGKTVVISFGVDDQHSYMATVDTDDIRNSLRNT